MQAPLADFRRLTLRFRPTPRRAIAAIPSKTPRIQSTTPRVHLKSSGNREAFSVYWREFRWASSEGQRPRPGLCSRRRAELLVFVSISKLRSWAFVFFKRSHHSSRRLENSFAGKNRSVVEARIPSSWRFTRSGHRETSRSRVQVRDSRRLPTNGRQKGFWRKTWGQNPRIRAVLDKTDRGDKGAVANYWCLRINTAFCLSKCCRKLLLLYILLFLLYNE